MAPVKVTVAIGRECYPFNEVADPRIRAALQGAAKQVAAKLAGVRCPTHQRGPIDVRIHFDSGRRGQPQIRLVLRVARGEGRPSAGVTGRARSRSALPRTKPRGVMPGRRGVGFAGRGPGPRRDRAR